MAKVAAGFSLRFSRPSSSSSYSYSTTKNKKSRTRRRTSTIWTKGKILLEYRGSVLLRGAVKTAKRVVNDLLSVFYPSSCSVCGKEDGQKGICADCLCGIPYITEDRCQKCGKHIEPYAGAMPRCNECRTTHYFFRQRSNRGSS